MGPDPRARPTTRQVGVPALLVAPNKSDMVDDEELLDLVEMEVRELSPDYDGRGLWSSGAPASSGP